jgi:hypothetical protein
VAAAVAAAAADVIAGNSSLSLGINVLNATKIKGSDRLPVRAFVFY